MIRLAITVEGETEEDFVRQVLALHLNSKEIYPFPILLGRANTKVGGGGNVTIERLATDMASHYHRFDFVTSLVDFYGFKDKENRTVEELERDIIQDIDRRLTPNWDRRKTVPYVQRHEFEGLLFSRVDAFTTLPQVSQEILQELTAIRKEYHTPEDINDNPDTAPSKRITQLIPRYNKRVNGPGIARQIGLTTIRNQCPRFDSWLTRLESLAA